MCLNQKLQEHETSLSLFSNGFPPSMRVEVHFEKIFSNLKIIVGLCRSINEQVKIDNIWKQKIRCKNLLMLKAIKMVESKLKWYNSKVKQMESKAQEYTPISSKDSVYGDRGISPW